MIEKYDEKIEVMVHFKDGQVLPRVFRWGRRVYNIQKINLTYKERDGRDMVYHFSVSDEANAFQLSFYTRDLAWKIREVFNN